MDVTINTRLRCTEALVCRDARIFMWAALAASTKEATRCCNVYGEFVCALCRDRRAEDAHQQWRMSSTSTRTLSSAVDCAGAHGPTAEGYALSPNDV